MYSLLSQEDLENGEDVAECPSCSLIVKVIYDPVREFVNEENKDTFKNCIVAVELHPNPSMWSH